MSFESFLIDLKLKMKQNRWPFYVFLLFWFLGFIMLFILDPDKNIGNILLISLGIRESALNSDLVGLYTLIWPILLETIIFGFIFGSLFEKYNPVITSRFLARHHRNHSVVIGYQHLGERLVDYFRENKKLYALMEPKRNLVENLINSGEPVVIGDPTDEDNLKFAAIQKAKEIFLVSNNIRESIVLCEKIRDLNKKCEIYVRLFEEDYEKYFKAPPINAFTFSTSKWAMESIREWTSEKTGNVLVLGRDNLTQRIAEYMAGERGRLVYIVDPIFDVDVYDDTPNIKAIHDTANRINLILDHVDLTTITEVFICWKNEEEFSDSLYLVSRFNELYPNIQVYVRIFDEELAEIMKKFNAMTFSSSSYAFDMLKKKVDKKSALK